MTDDTEGTESPSEDKHYEPRRLDKIKQHVKKHQTAYIVAGTAVVTATVAVAVTVVVMKTGGTPEVSVSAQNKAVFQWMPRNEVKVTIKPRLNPGNVIQHDQTGTTYPSQALAAEALGISPSKLSRHLNGKKVSVDGNTFTKIRDGIFGDVQDLMAA